jgi:hypothetical protein
MSLYTKYRYPEYPVTDLFKEKISAQSRNHNGKGLNKM